MAEISEVKPMLRPATKTWKDEIILERQKEKENIAIKHFAEFLKKYIKE